MVDCSSRLLKPMVSIKIPYPSWCKILRRVFKDILEWRSEGHLATQMSVHRLENTFPVFSN